MRPKLKINHPLTDREYKKSTKSVLGNKKKKKNLLGEEVLPTC
jgi:hypothetical protein